MTVAKTRKNRGKIAGAMEKVEANKAECDQVAYNAGLKLQAAMKKLDISENEKNQAIIRPHSGEYYLEASSIEKTELQGKLKKANDELDTAKAQVTQLNPCGSIHEHLYSSIVRFVGQSHTSVPAPLLSFGRSTDPTSVRWSSKITTCKNSLDPKMLVQEQKQIPQKIYE
ncbi:uncharacterized protein PAC_09642 [Phialocephala subalpina]|uniref:Uncharacterized protein n=1 Tax=Phialocephala subalpina TaxID=576137 RepID=A0A1L7X411_9HELO|nr:uncharacterized protein PAC_09642 [Phialocephala subalpina]